MCVDAVMKLYFQHNFVYKECYKKEQANEDVIIIFLSDTADLSFPVIGSNAYQVPCNYATHQLFSRCIKEKGNQLNLNN